MAPSISLTNSIVLNYISFQRWMNCKVIHSPPISIVHWGSNALLFRKDLDYCGLLSGSDTVSKRNKRQFSLLKLLHITQISKNHRSPDFKLKCDSYQWPSPLSDYNFFRIACDNHLIKASKFYDMIFNFFQIVNKWMSHSYLINI